jgi:benzil reductase ((S)-benzoin forming)
VNNNATLALVTGTTRGIGAGIAAAAASSGATVATCNRSSTNSAHELVADLSDPSSWAALGIWFDDLVGLLKPERVVFIHNAATLTPIGFVGEVDGAAYQTNVLLNSAAPQVLGEAVARTALRTSTPTVIAQLSSGAGKSAYPGWSSYCASKAAVDMWVQSVGIEQATRGDLVRALSISPGVVDTGMQQEIRSTEPSGFPNVERFRDMHADGALADPVEVGARIWTIASEETWPNGTVRDLRSAE